MKLAKFLLPAALAILFSSCGAFEETGANKVVNGEVWKDTNGNVIQAHDDIIQVGSKFYWYGLDYGHNLYGKSDGKGFEAVKCYESTDLVNWKFKNNVVTRQSAAFLYRRDISNISVVYNKSTKNYVMWMTYGGYNALVATCDKPYGNFLVKDADFGINDGARSISLFADDDGQGYAIVYCKDDGDDTYKTFIYDLSDDYTQITSSKHSYGIACMAWPKLHNGRADIVKYEGKYYLIMAGYSNLYDNNNSGSSVPSYTNEYYDFIYGRYTGVRYAVADSIGGLSTSGLYSFGPEYYTTQEFSRVIDVYGKQERNFIITFNKWNLEDMSNSAYVWQKLIFEPAEYASASEKLYVPTFNEDAALIIDAFNGTVEGEN